MIHRLPIPTPFRVGRVNCYLIEDDPLTLVDVGPNSGALAGRARGGAAASTATGSRTSSGSSSPTSTPTTSGWSGSSPTARGAEVCALDVLAPVVEDFDAYAERNDELAQALMLRHGIARDMVTALAAMSRAYRGWGGSAPVTHVLHDGGELAFAGRTLRGPAPARATRPRTRSSSTRPTATLLAGDHLIKPHLLQPADLQPLGGRSASPAASARARC